MRYVGFWRRLIAFIVDTIILTIAQIPIDAIASPFTIKPDSLSNSSQSLTYLGANIIYALVIIVGWWLYWVTLQHKFGQTLGKKLLGIKVVDSQGKTPSSGVFGKREFIGKLASTILLGIGYLMIAFDSKKQGLHDKIAGTYVIKA